MKFKKYKLKDLVTIFNQKRIPLSGKERSQMEKKYPYYGAQGIIDYVDDYIFDGKYILVAEDGENLRSRKTSIATRASGKFWVNNHAHIIKNNDKSDFNFLYYYLFDLDVSEYLTGSVQPKLNKRNFENITINAPSLKKQQKIGYFLRMLDKKVLKNNSIISNLEELAQTLFKHWFVDFEFPNEEGKPYKSSGGKMVESELGMIPEGWGVGQFSELYSVKSGYAFKSSWWSEAGVPVIKIKDIENNTINNADLSFVSYEKSELASNFKVNSGDILIALTGATAGKFALIPKFDIDLLVNQRVGKFYYNDDNLSVRNSAYLFGLLLQQEFNNRIIDLGSGSAQSNISPTNIAKMKVILPDKKYFNMFNAEFSGLIKFITELSYENEKLIDIRDTILPKLLSGEIELPDDMEVTDDVSIS